MSTVTLACSVAWAFVLHWLAQVLIREDKNVPQLFSQKTTRSIALGCTPIIVTLSLQYLETPYCWTGLLFASALVIATITDLQTLLISRYTSLFLVPLGWLFATYGLLPINLLSSVMGSLLGYLILATIAKIFHAITKKQGLGQGDSDLLAYIGAFTGPMGVWLSLFFGSVVGAAVSSVLLATKRATRTTPIPFGPFLALGALIYLFCGNYLIKILFLR